MRGWDQKRRLSLSGAFYAALYSHACDQPSRFRYGGEIIPVDYLSTSLAEQFGFTPVKVYCLKQQKGNSSQQMKKFGKSALRKSITIWKKEG